jgi:hypothetical protein
MVCLPGCRRHEKETGNPKGLSDSVQFVAVSREAQATARASSEEAKPERERERERAREAKKEQPHVGGPPNDPPKLNEHMIVHSECTRFVDIGWGPPGSPASRSSGGAAAAACEANDYFCRATTWSWAACQPPFLGPPSRPRLPNLVHKSSHHHPCTLPSPNFVAYLPREIDFHSSRVSRVWR